MWGRLRAAPALCRSLRLPRSRLLWSRLSPRTLLREEVRQARAVAEPDPGRAGGQARVGRRRDDVAVETQRERRSVQREPERAGRTAERHAGGERGELAASKVSVP